MIRTIALLTATLAPVLAVAQATQPINTVLMTSIDARKARVGDIIKVRSYSGFTATGGQRVPPGTILIGHVTEASKLVKGSTDSRLSILFDQALLASGQTVAVHLGIAGLAATPPSPGPEEANAMNPTADSPYLGAASPGTPAIAANGTGPNHDTSKSRGQLLSGVTKGSAPTTLGDRVAPIASVGSTVPGITLQPNSTLISSTNNINLRTETPLVLLQIPNAQ